MHKRVVETIRFSFDNRNPCDAYMIIESCLLISLLITGTISALILVYALLDCFASVNDIICGMVPGVSTCTNLSIFVRYVQLVSVWLGIGLIGCVTTIVGGIVPLWVIMVMIRAWCNYECMTAIKAEIPQKQKSFVHSKWTAWFCVLCGLAWCYMWVAYDTRTVNSLIVINAIAHPIIWLVSTT